MPARARRALRTAYALRAVGSATRCLPRFNSYADLSSSVINAACSSRARTARARCCCCCTQPPTPPFLRTRGALRFCAGSAARAFVARRAARAYNLPRARTRLRAPPLYCLYLCLPYRRAPFLVLYAAYAAVFAVCLYRRFCTATAARALFVLCRARAPLLCFGSRCAHAAREHRHFCFAFTFSALSSSLIVLYVRRIPSLVPRCFALLPAARALPATASLGSAACQRTFSYVLFHHHLYATWFCGYHTLRAYAFCPLHTLPYLCARFYAFYCRLLYASPSCGFTPWFAPHARAVRALARMPAYARCCHARFACRARSYLISVLAALRCCLLIFGSVWKTACCCGGTRARIRADNNASACAPCRVWRRRVLVCATALRAVSRAVRAPLPRLQRRHAPAARSPAAIAPYARFTTCLVFAPRLAARARCIPTLPFTTAARGSLPAAAARLYMQRCVLLRAVTAHFRYHCVAAACALPSPGSKPFSGPSSRAFPWRHSATFAAPARNAAVPARALPRQRSFCLVLASRHIPLPFLT